VIAAFFNIKASEVRPRPPGTAGRTHHCGQGIFVEAPRATVHFPRGMRLISEEEFGALVESALAWILKRGFRAVLPPNHRGYAAVLTDDRHWLRFDWATAGGAILLSWGDVLPAGSANDDPFRSTRPLEELIPGHSPVELEAIGAIVGVDRTTVMATLQRLSSVLEALRLAPLFARTDGRRNTAVIERSAALRSEYLDFVRTTGLENLVKAPPREALLAAEAEMAARWQAAEHAPTADELSSRLEQVRRIGTRAQDEGWSLEQVWLDALATQLDGAVPRVIEDFEPPNDSVFFYVGVYPTGMFNAQVCAVKGGYLVLVNQGLMMLFYQTMRVYSWSVRDAADPPPPPGGKARMARALATALRAYLDTGHSATAAPIEPVAGKRAVPGNLILTAMEKFVLAHEYAHIIAGHLQRATPVDSANGLTLLIKQRDDEFEADRLGMLLLLLAISLPKADEYGQYAALKLSCEIAGPILSLELGALLLRAYRQRQGLPQDETFEEMMRSDHPPAALRIFHLKHQVRELGLEAYLTVAEAAQSWLRDICDLVIEQLGTATPTIEE
jgi:hypothetical protein